MNPTGKSTVRSVEKRSHECQLIELKVREMKCCGSLVGPPTKSKEKSRGESTLEEGAGQLCFGCRAVMLESRGARKFLEREKRRQLQGVAGRIVRCYLQRVAGHKK